MAQAKKAAASAEAAEADGRQPADGMAAAEELHRGLEAAYVEYMDELREINATVQARIAETYTRTVATANEASAHRQQRAMEAITAGDPRSYQEVQADGPKEARSLFESQMASLNELQREAAAETERARGRFMSSLADAWESVDVRSLDPMSLHSVCSSIGLAAQYASLGSSHPPAGS